jgi:hypothetical protein
MVELTCTEGGDVGAPLERGEELDGLLDFDAL